MKRTSILFFAICTAFIFAQKIQIVDFETKNPIPEARILTENNVYYTNDEGFSLLPERSQNITISASGYETLNQNSIQSTIPLKPKYSEIDEVKIVSIDFQKILKNVLKNYNEIYYSKPIVYNVTIKQKAFENNQLKLLMIADGKFWSKDGNYNAKDAYQDKFDKFVQLQIDNLRYLKSEPFNNTIRAKKPQMSHDNIGDLFLQYELWRTLSLSKRKNVKVSGKLLSELGEEQEISYSIKSDSSLVYTGKFTYNTKDNAISHFELDFHQSSSEPKIFKDENGANFKRQLGDGTISFDYYKKNGQYYPSKTSYVTRGFKVYSASNSFEYRSEKSFIFKSVEETSSSGVQNPVKINEDYWTNLKVSESKGAILLTKEEEIFISEKE